MNKTGISWTDRTWNPVSGCSKVSPGCQNCYAEYLTVHRFHRSFDMKLRPEKLKEVRNIPAGSRVFVNSMSDLFHEDVPLFFIRDIFHAMNTRPDVTFQILTKRPERARTFFEVYSYGPDFKKADNVWLGVSIEMQAYVKRLNVLKAINCVPVKFVSFEPLLENITAVNLQGIDWIIIGGESGPKHRPFKEEWAEHLLTMAKAQGVAVWMKQLGGHKPGTALEDLPEHLRIREFPGVRIKESVNQ